MFAYILLLASLSARTLGQSVQGLGEYTVLPRLQAPSTDREVLWNTGVSGGNGSQGGIGSLDNPVLKAQSFITDALIPIKPNTTRQLARGPAPVLSSTNSTPTTCTQLRSVVIDASPKGAQQEMVGFGHAWTDSTVSVFNQLEPAVLDQVMEELFGQDGNNMGV